MNPNSNGDAKELNPDDFALKIYRCRRSPARERARCLFCHDSFSGGQMIDFFLDKDANLPVCGRCAVQRGYIARGEQGRRWHCWRDSKSGAILAVPLEEWVPDCELDPAIDRWLDEKFPIS